MLIFIFIKNKKVLDFDPPKVQILVSYLNILF